MVEENSLNIKEQQKIKDDIHIDHIEDDGFRAITLFLAVFPNV